MYWETVVVGSGIVGLSAAWRLAQRDEGRVLLIDGKFPASGATGLGTGSVHVQRWSKEDISLILRSKRLMSEVSERTNGSFRFYPAGRLTLAGDRDRDTLASHADLICEMGVDLERLDPDELRARFPNMEFSDIALGTYTDDDGYIYPPALAWALAGIVRDAGVILWEGVPVQRIDVFEDKVRGIVIAQDEVIRCDRVVLTAGVWTQKILRASGLDLPVQQSVTQSAVVLGRDIDLWSSMPSVLDGSQGLLTIPRNPGTLVASALPGEKENEDVDVEEDITVEWSELEAGFLEAIHPMLRERFPGYGLGPVVGGWGGVLDVTPDQKPFVGPYEGVGGLSVACGLSGYGIQRGPAVGEVVADLATGQEPFIDIGAYRLDRFPSDYKFDYSSGSNWHNPF